MLLKFSWVRERVPGVECTRLARLFKFVSISYQDKFAHMDGWVDGSSAELFQGLTELLSGRSTISEEQQASSSRPTAGPHSAGPAGLIPGVRVAKPRGAHTCKSSGQACPSGAAVLIQWSRALRLMERSVKFGRARALAPLGPS